MLWVVVRIYGSQKLRSEDVAGEMVAKGLWREGPPHILGGQGWYPLLQPLARGDRSAGAQVAIPRSGHPRGFQYPSFVWCVRCGDALRETILFSYSVSKEDIVITRAPLASIGGY